VVESVGQDFSISFSLQLLISWLAPSWRLNLTNGDHSAYSSVSGIGQSLWIEFGLVDKKTTTRNHSPFSLCENDHTTHQKIELGVGSVVESLGQDFSISFSLQLLISWLAPSRCLNLTNGLPGDHSALQVLFCCRDWLKPWN
jgi:hypothetical protein